MMDIKGTLYSFFIIWHESTPKLKINLSHFNTSGDTHLLHLKILLKIFKSECENLLKPYIKLQSEISEVQSEGMGGEVSWMSN